MKEIPGDDVDGVIIDDTYGYDETLRIYKDIAPTIRSARQGLKVIVRKNYGKEQCNLHSCHAWQKPG